MADGEKLNDEKVLASPRDNGRRVGQVVINIHPRRARPLRRAHIGNHGRRRPRAAQSGGEQGERKPVEQSRAEFHAAE